MECVTVANLQISLPVARSVRRGLSLTQVTIRWASVETQRGPDVCNGPITFDLRKLKIKIKIVGNVGGGKSERTKS